jgi:hypothetical protein
VWALVLLQGQEQQVLLSLVLFAAHWELLGFGVQGLGWVGQ